MSPFWIFLELLVFLWFMGHISTEFCENRWRSFCVFLFAFNIVTYLLTYLLSYLLSSFCVFLFAPPPSICRICFVVLVMRKGGENSWSGPCHLVCTFEVFHVHSYQDQFIQPGWAECSFCVFSLGLYFVYSFVFLWFVCMSPSFYVSLGSWVISLTVFGTSVTNLNEPPGALATSTIAWVRS